MSIMRQTCRKGWAIIEVELWIAFGELELCVTDRQPAFKRLCKMRTSRELLLTCLSKAWISRHLAMVSCSRALKSHIVSSDLATGHSKLGS
jgi:hypothetical protein